MKLFVISEDSESEARVSITPDISKKLVSMGHEVFVERAAGDRAGFGDEEYQLSGAFISDKSYLKDCDVVFSINNLTEKYLKLLRQETILISPQDIFNNAKNLELFESFKLTAFALDMIPRTTRAQYMDILSSQASLAGYKAMIEASHLLNRAIPLMMTTAGTIPAAKVLIIGAGVAGLQAIATARRLGAVVSAFDVRSSAKEQVESLGAKFVEIESSEKIDGVYAKEMGADYKKAQAQKLREVLPAQDIVITTAQIPGKRAPVIIKNDMIESMKAGSIIIDLAAKTGGNCELTGLGRTIDKNGVKIVGFENILNLIPFDASRLFAKNILAFFELLTEKMKDQPNISKIEDEIIKSTLLTYKGEVLVKIGDN